MPRVNSTKSLHTRIYRETRLRTEQHTLQRDGFENTDTVNATRPKDIPIRKSPTQNVLAKFTAPNWAASWAQDKHGKKLRNLAPNPSRAAPEIKKKRGFVLKILKRQLGATKIVEMCGYSFFPSDFEFFTEIFYFGGPLQAP